MAAVRYKNSRAEMVLRRSLHAAGVRYRLHVSDIVGRPDVSIRKYKIAIFVDGDFWHGNAWRTRRLKALSDLFPNRGAWWTAKIRRNMERDSHVTSQLIAAGWTVLRIWESDLLSSPQQSVTLAVKAISQAREQTASSVTPSNGPLVGGRRIEKTGIGSTGDTSSSEIG